MEEVVLNVLTHDGTRVVKVLSDAEIDIEKYRAWVRPEALPFLETICFRDKALNLYSVEMRWPVYGPCDMQYLSPKGFRRFMVVNYQYAPRVSECVKLAVEAFFEGTHFRPGYAFVRELPAGAGDLVELYGVTLLRSEWMPARCVAVGGFQ